MREPGTLGGRRKDDHLRLAHAQQAQLAQAPDRGAFADVEIVHHALDGIDAAQVRLETTVDTLRWTAPLYVNGMTGGTDRTAAVNRDLAIAARETGVAIASGSVGIALDDPSAAEGFRVLRTENPDGFVMANLGIGRSVDEARRAVDLLAADALQIHLNAVQETVMPEGTRDFSRWPGLLEQIVAAVEVPVIVKEVGFGLSPRTLRRLHDMGVRIADVSGTGGTDFLRIENARRPVGAAHRLDYSALTGFGQSAVACLLAAPSPSPHLLASGGVRSPLDVVTALALGAEAVGVAGAFLAPAVSGGAEAATATIRAWLEQTTELMALLGAPTPADLRRTDLLLRGRVAEECRLRGIDAGAFATRRDRPGAVPVPDSPTDHSRPTGPVGAPKEQP